MVEEAFIRLRNKTFARHVSLIMKQLRGETDERFYRKSKELAENCDFEHKGGTLIKDVFITNFIDAENHKELLKQTVEPRKILKLAVIIELGMRSQHQIQADKKTLVQKGVYTILYFLLKLVSRKQFPQTRLSATITLL